MVIFYIIILLFLFSQFSLVFNEKIVKTEYVSPYSHFSLPITFKAYDRFTYFKYINLEKDYSLFYNTPANIEDIKNSQVISINDIDVPIQLIESGSSIANLNFTFMFLNINQMKYYTNANEAIALAYKFSDNKFGFLYQLKEKEIIDNLIFGFEPEGREKGNLYLGGIPNEIIEHKNKAYCKIIKTNSFWSCSLDSVFFKQGREKIVYENPNAYVQFQPAIGGILVPKSFFKFLETKVFFYFLNSGYCRIGENEKRRIFVCIREHIQQLPDINLVIDGYVFPIKTSELYDLNQRRIRNSPMDSILFIENIYEETIFQLGGLFLSKYISIFDYNADDINFYTNDTVEKIIKYTPFSRIKRKIKNCFISLFIVSIVGSTLIVYSFIVKRETLNIAKKKKFYIELK